VQSLLHSDLDQHPWLPSLFPPLLLDLNPLLLDLTTLSRRARLPYLPLLDLNPLCMYLRPLLPLLHQASSQPSNGGGYRIFTRRWQR
jgi:hypothetical protein